MTSFSSLTSGPNPPDGSSELLSPHCHLLLRRYPSIQDSGADTPPSIPALFEVSFRGFAATVTASLFEPSLRRFVYELRDFSQWYLGEPALDSEAGDTGHFRVRFPSVASTGHVLVTISISSRDGYPHTNQADASLSLWLEPTQVSALCQGFAQLLSPEPADWSIALDLIAA